ncbi:MAG: hypothetical protein JO157_16145, partial [Acetobacteraceae bacterium]|nr:hypothetical protein [Acetobacteraceae bacterium]
AQEKAYAAEEMNHLLFSLLYSLDCYFMSHPLALRGASWKGEQLVRAARFGFSVPASLITDQPSEVRRLGRSAADGAVFKSMSMPNLAAHRVEAEDQVASGVPTTRVPHDDENALAGVEEMPCFFQHYAPKAYELRVTVVGDEVFAVRINSQDDPRTAVDFRDYSVDIRYEAVRVPPDVERRCVGLIHSYGLQYGAIDLIVTPAGDYVFLENNPVGQFLFVEQLAPELEITKAVAERLAWGAGSDRGAGGAPVAAMAASLGLRHAG